MFFKHSNLNSNLALTLGYINPALNNSALNIPFRLRRFQSTLLLLLGWFSKKTKERERQLTTSRANETTGLTNGRGANWAPEVVFSPFRALSCRQLTFPSRVNTALHIVWYKSYPISDAPLSGSARRSFAPSQRRRRHNRSFVWIKSLSGMIFVTA